MSTIIRPYHPSDLVDLYRICLQTGADGKDATSLYHDPDLLGAYYAAPYAVLEPALCTVVVQASAVIGYVLGTSDSQRFYERCEEAWFPPLRQRYPVPADTDNTPDAHLRRAIHFGHTVSSTWQTTYPAHLHIDILPAGQGLGLGHQLIDLFLKQLQSLGVPGVHLGVSGSNSRAIQFYQRCGFTVLAHHAHSLTMGYRLQT